MKLVTVVIKPFKLEDVREALSSIGIQGLTVTEVKGLAVRKVTPSCTAVRNTALTFCQK
jgi:nitrogen regulatory protein PII